MTFSTKIAAAAAEVRPARWLLTLLALPFYVLGWVAGLVCVAGLWMLGALKAGFGDARAQLARPAARPAVVELVEGDG